MKKTPQPVPVPSINQAVFLGESVARQIEKEKRYFIEKHGKEPATALLSGSLSHSRGLVQLLSDSGYNSCLFKIAGDNMDYLPSDIFVWKGFDGSSVTVKRSNCNNDSDHDPDDKFFTLSEQSQNELPRYSGDLNHPASSFFKQIASLERHLFDLEHKYFTAEKLLSLAAFSGHIPFPVISMNEALQEIHFCRFTGSDPGKIARREGKEYTRSIKNASGILDAEITSIILMAGNSPGKSSPGKYTLMIINPHPFDVDSISEVEIQLDETNSGNPDPERIMLFNEKGERVPVQFENTETSKIRGSRKKIVFRATVPAGSITRYSAIFNDIYVPHSEAEPETDFAFSTERSELIIDRISGFPSLYEYEGQKLLVKGDMSFSLTNEFSEPVFSSLISSPEISEKGPVRTVVESQFICGLSSIHVRYIIHENEPYFDVEIAVDRIDKDKILTWSVPVGYNMNCIGRAISGINCCKHRKREYLFRDWVGMKNFEGDISLSLFSSGAYSYDIVGNTVRIFIPGATEEPAYPHRFRFFPGKTDDIIDRSFNNSDLFNNPLITWQVFSSEAGDKPFSGIRISDSAINLQSVRLNDSGDLVLRLLNPCKETKRFTIEVAISGLSAETEIAPKKLKTLVVNKSSGRFLETDLPERIIK